MCNLSKIELECNENFDLLKEMIFEFGHNKTNEELNKIHLNFKNILPLKPISLDVSSGNIFDSNGSLINDYFNKSFNNFRFRITFEKLIIKENIETKKYYYYCFN